ncbi:MAG: TMAO reductase system periplasmic protein TorT [Alphaproteobacteria bacterium]
MLRTWKRALGGATAIVGALTFVSAAQAQDAWWPVKVFDATSGENVETEYSPLEKAAQPWNLCVLFPHMKDSFWVAVAYGIVEEAKRQNVNMTLFEAGGYENLPRQLSQFDDCMAGDFDAIIVGPISEAGLALKFEEGIAAGKPVIATVNPVAEAKVTAKMFVEFDTMGEQTGKYLVDSLAGDEANVVNFPGPAGSGWAESFNDGFKKAIDGVENVHLLDEKFGDSGVSVQLQLIQDALQAYPEMNVIWGTAPTAEAAMAAVAEVGRIGEIQIMSSYENQAMLDALERGDILGFATQYPVLEGRVAIDMAVRALQGEEVIAFVKPIPDMIAEGTVDQIDMTQVLAPADWSPEYSVEAQ